MIARFTTPKLASLKLTKPKGSCVFRHLPPLVGLFAACGFVLCAAPALAQVNIDQGKSAAEMFSGDCATCHKSAKGLANGRSSGALAGFLREHYTSGPQQAAALAAYVLGAGSGPAPTANLKPGTGPGTAPGEPKTSDAKPGEKARAGRQPEQDTKVEAEPVNEPAVAGAGRKPAAAGKHEPRSVTASRGPRQEPETPPPAPEATPVAAPVATPEANPAPVVTAPATPETASPATSETASPAAPQPSVTAAAPAAVPESGSVPNTAPPSNSEASPSASAAGPAETPANDGTPAENAPVPRDDIPD
jgi:hypothetical protein